MIYNKDRFIIVNKDCANVGQRGTLLQRVSRSCHDFVSGSVLLQIDKKQEPIWYQLSDLISLEWNDEEPMSIDRYRELANAVSGPWLHETDSMQKLLYSTMALCSESGEIASITTKIGWQGHPLTEEKIEKIMLEMGDCCWYLGLLAHTLDISMEEILKQNLKKLHGRYPNGFTTEESINRKV